MFGALCVKVCFRKVIDRRHAARKFPCAGGSTDPSGEFQRRSAIGNTFHLLSIALLYAFLIAPTGAGAITIEGSSCAPARPEQFGHMQQRPLNSVLLPHAPSPSPPPPDHLARSGVEIVDEALAMCPLTSLSAHSTCRAIRPGHHFSHVVGLFARFPMHMPRPRALPYPH